MGIVEKECQDKNERIAFIQLVKDYNKAIDKHLSRVHRIEKELNEGNITQARLQELKIATKLISKDLDCKSYISKEIVSKNIEKIYEMVFNTEETQLKQVMIELKRCSKLIQDFNNIHIQESWGSQKYRRRCKLEGKDSDLVVEQLLDIKQEVRLKHIEFKLIKERQALIEEKDYLLNVANEIGKIISKDIAEGLIEILNNLNITTYSVHINKNKQDKKVIGQAYKYLYIIFKNRKGF